MVFEEKIRRIDHSAMMIIGKFVSSSADHGHTKFVDHVCIQHYIVMDVSEEA